MKLYNVIKRIETKGHKPIVIPIIQSCTWITAIQEINEQYDNQKSVMFQDVNQIQDDSETPFFEVFINGAKTIYLVEESLFDAIAQLSKPKMKMHIYQMN